MHASSVSGSLMHVRELQWIEPVVAMQCLAHRAYLTFLDSASRRESLGRYSYLTCDPFSTYVLADGQGSCNGEAIEGDYGAFFATCSPAIPKSTAPISRRSREGRPVFLLTI